MVALCWPTRFAALPLKKLLAAERSLLRPLTSGGASHVVLKDFVKSAKSERPDLLHVAVDGELGAAARDLVRARGARFNRGVVFKEYVATRKYAVEMGDSPNEWRLWFGRGELLCAAPNSLAALRRDATRVPAEVLTRAAEAARALGAPFLTIDVAEATEDVRWRPVRTTAGGGYHWTGYSRRVLPGGCKYCRPWIFRR